MINLNIALPLSVYNRALDLYGEPAEPTIVDARRALLSAEGRMSSWTELPDGPTLSHFSRAVAEYMSSDECGGWTEGA